MLEELLRELKRAKEEGDTKTANRIERGLNRLGMDNTTINILLKEV